MHPFPIFDDTAVEVWELIHNFISHLLGVWLLIYIMRETELEEWMDTINTYYINSLILTPNFYLKHNRIFNHTTRLSIYQTRHQEGIDIIKHAQTSNPQLLVSRLIIPKAQPHISTHDGSVNLPNKTPRRNWYHKTHTDIKPTIVSKPTNYTWSTTAYFITRRVCQFTKQDTKKEWIS